MAEHFLITFKKKNQLLEYKVWKCYAEINQTRTVSIGHFRDLNNLIFKLRQTVQPQTEEHRSYPRFKREFLVVLETAYEQL